MNRLSPARQGADESAPLRASALPVRAVSVDAARPVATPRWLRLWPSWLTNDPQGFVNLPGPCTQILPGSKTAAGLITCAAPPVDIDALDDLTMSRTSVLCGTRMPALLVSQTLERGSYGKFRLGVDAAGRVFGVKEFRCDTWVRRGFQLGAVKPPKTHAMPRHAIEAEAQLSALAKGALTFYDLIDVDDKIYGVMPYSDGSDMFELAQALALYGHNFGRSCAGVTAVMAYVGYSVAATLEDFHAKGFVHDDVRLENILWDSTGRVVLNDFGKSKQVREDGAILGIVSGPISHLAPEYFAVAEHPSGKVDVWSLAVSLLDLYLGAADGNVNPFSQGRFEVDDPKRLRPHQQNTLMTWGVFYAAYCASGTVAADDTTADSGAYRKFVRLFAAIQAADPVLCDFLIRRMLTPNKARRASAAEVTTFMRRHLTAKRFDTALRTIKRTAQHPYFLSRNRAVLTGLRKKAKQKLRQVA